LIGDSSFWRDGLTSRLRNLRDDSAPGPAAAGLAPSGWWISGHGARGEQDGDSSNAAKLKTSAGGVMGGVDTLLRTGWHAGLAGGYGRSDLRVDGRSSSARMDSYTVGAYTGARMGNVGLRFGLAHTWHALETTRESSFADFSETNRASYRARTAQAFGEAGFTLRWNATSLEPYVGLAYVSLRSSGYDESGMAGLHAQASGQELTYATLGARLRRVVRLGNAGGLLRAGLAWRHAGGDTTTAATHAFDGSNSFTVTGVPIARETALLEAGLDLTLAKNTDLTVSYNGQYASQAKQHGITANLRWRF
jgi:outer membrane autotransporter protein